MKGFELSKGSWHYRLVRWGGNWRRYDNFCDYFWAVVRAALKCILLSILALAVISALCVTIWIKPFVFLGAVSALVLYACGAVKLEEVRGRRARVDGVARGPGFFKLKYRSFKGKFCPKIEWVD